MRHPVDTPTLTVFLPNYNHAHYLPEALASLQSQTYQPLEIILIDDASTDDSVAIIERFAATYPLIKFIQNDENRGVVFNENRAIEMSRGTHFFGVSADDRVHPELLEKSMRLLAKHPQAAFCSSLSDRIDEKGRNLGLYPTPVIAKRECFLSPTDVLQRLRRHGTWFMGNTTIWRKEALQEHGEHYPQLKFFYDGFMSQVLALRYGACFIPESLGEFRQVEGQLCQEALDLDIAAEVFQAAAELMRTRYKDRFPEDYVNRFYRRSMANAIEASALQAREEQIKHLDQELASGVTDRLLQVIVRLGMAGSFLVMKIFLAKVRHGTFGAIKRSLRLITRRMGI